MKRTFAGLAFFMMTTTAFAAPVDVNINVCSTGQDSQISQEPMVLHRALNGVVSTEDASSSLHGASFSCKSYIKGDSVNPDNHHFVCLLIEKDNDIIVFGDGTRGEPAAMTVLSGTGKWDNATGSALQMGDVTTMNVNQLSDTRNSFQGCVNYSGQLETAD
ncbi:hypothetical protein Q5Y75_26940 [Ruegeria sp. 2205SS24-7]|uniref:hypothetical protein n=1 Tax=Ruegeria discodermiae TaxID=3064389 RepID=UPI002740E603|nr:hypothetical protein [Ruegeria sp. 2205SS24-7]MDP5220828.1 hypothetical protein [Ruegeria sp. 2205SS24-7]